MKRFTVDLVDHYGRAGHNEFGEDVVYTVMNITLTESDGYRWVLTTWGASEKVQKRDPEEGLFWGYNSNFEAEVAKGKRLVERIQTVVDARGLAGLHLTEYWLEIDPAYGSRAYVEGGYEEMNAMREREDALMAIE